MYLTCVFFVTCPQVLLQDSFAADKISRFLLTTKPLHRVADHKAAAVPHSAMAIEAIMRSRSTIVAFLSKDTFAAIGPITHNAKTVKDPRMAMIEPKSGTRMDTVTARQARLMRSQTINTRLSEQLNLRARVMHDF